MKELESRLLSEFLDKEYAHSYMESHVIDRIAAQIYALRKDRQWSQEDLSNKSGIAQESISKYENGDFSSITLKTLIKLSRAFDVSIRLSFESFRDCISDIVNLNEQKLVIRDRNIDLIELHVVSGRNDDVCFSDQFGEIDVKSMKTNTRRQIPILASARPYFYVDTAKRSSQNKNKSTVIKFQDARAGVL